MSYELFDIKDKETHEFRINYTLIPKWIESFYGISCGDCVNTYEYKEMCRNYAEGAKE